MNESVENTSKKLDILKDAEEQVQRQFEKGEVSESQYRALKQEIISTNSILDNTKKKAKDAEEALKDVGKKETDFKKLEERADSFKESMGDIADKAEAGAKAIGAAAGAAATYSVKFSSDYEEALNTLTVSSGAAANEIDGLNEVMEAVYKNNFGEDVQEVGEALGVIVQQTGEIDPTKLQSMAESAFTLQDTFDMDISESIRAVNQLMNQFGISSEEAFDLIAQGAQNGLNKNDNLLDSVNEYGPKFAQMGLSATDMFNMFKAGAEAGIFDIDKLGDAVNEFSVRVKDGTADNAFKELGLDIESTKTAFGQGGEAAKQAMQTVFGALQSVSDPLEQNTIGVELFGSMWEDTGGKAILAMGNMEGEASNAAGTMENIKNIRYDDLQSEFESLGRSINTDLAKPLGDELAPIAKDVIDAVKAELPKVKEILSDVIDGVKDFIQFFQEHADIIIPLIGAIAAGFLAWNVVTMIQGLIAVIKTLHITLAMNPAAMIVTAIAAVVTGLYLLWNNCEDFRNWVKNALDSIVQFFVDAWEAIKRVFSNWGSFFSGLWGKIKDTFSNLGTSIADAIGGAVKSGINGVITIIENTINSAIGLINGAIGLINKIPGVSVGTLGYVGLPRLAKGGILTNGSAMVAEAGPEIIEMVNGKTIVTPLSDTAKNTSLERNFGQQKGTLKQEISLKIENFYNNREQDIRELTEEIMEIAQELKERDDKVYA